eukprot:sb/3477366/
MRKSYFDNWDDFYAASEQLYLDEPSAFKYTMKYRHCDGKMLVMSRSTAAFDNAAGDFAELSKAIGNLIRYKLPNASREPRKMLVQDIHRRLDAAQCTLNDMQNEVSFK